jgi:Phage gp6-like head-tail connector protein
VNFVTMTQAKAHLRVDHDFDDADINRKREHAAGVVLDYTKADIDDTGFDWVDDLGEPLNVPPEVVAATLLILGGIYENRDGEQWRSPQPLSPAAMDLLWRHRTPAFA